MRVLLVRYLWVLILPLLPVFAAAGPWHAHLHSTAGSAVHAAADHPHDDHHDSPSHEDSERHCPVCHLLHTPTIVAAPVTLPLLTERVSALDARVIALHMLTVEHCHSGRAPPAPVFA